jgi:hypothetical protein
MATGEPGFRELMVRLSRCESLFSSNLLEAEVQSKVQTCGIWPALSS